MKKLLYQFDTDPIASVFDNVVAHDGGADVVVPYGGITPANVGALVDGAIFTRAPKHKKLTAIFCGGSDMLAGEALLAAVKKKFFDNFRVSVMLDSNGSNTTAAAGVAWLHHAAKGKLSGKRAVVLAGTGPVGQRAAVMLAREGCRVAITGRSMDKAQVAVKAIAERFKVEVEAIEAPDLASRVKALAGAHIVFASGAAGIQLLDEASWKNHPTIELLADANATPPLGIEGVEMMDKMRERHGKLVFGALGFGALKIALHRACIGKLFEQQDLSLDCDEIYAIAKSMVGSPA